MTTRAWKPPYTRSTAGVYPDPDTGTLKSTDDTMVQCTLAQTKTLQSIRNILAGSLAFIIASMLINGVIALKLNEDSKTLDAMTKRVNNYFDQLDAAHLFQTTKRVTDFTDDQIIPLINQTRDDTIAVLQVIVNVTRELQLHQVGTEVHTLLDEFHQFIVRFGGMLGSTP